MDINGELQAAIMAPEPQEWASSYTPEQADEYAAEIDDLEYELDDGWPGWRKFQPFSELPADKIAWIKQRLNRRSLIIGGHGDWGLSIVLAGPMPIASVVPPSGSHPAQAALAAKCEDRSVFDPVVSVLTLARRLGVSKGEVQDALAHLPPGTRGVSRALKEWLRRQTEEGAEFAALDAPSPSAPLPKMSKKAVKDA